MPKPKNFRRKGRIGKRRPRRGPTRLKKPNSVRVVRTVRKIIKAAEHPAPKHRLTVNQFHQAGRKARIQGPLGPPGTAQTLAFGHWPQSYVKESGQPGHLTYDFCQMVGRFGCDQKTEPGAGAMSLLGTTGKFSQVMAIGPGVIYGQPGQTAFKYDWTTWAVDTLSAFATRTPEWKLDHLEFIFVPANATTASARSYWAAWVDDPTLCCLDYYTAPGKISTNFVQNLSNALVFPAWQTTTLRAHSFDRSWKAVNQSFSDGTAAGSGVTDSAALNAYLKLHSPGCLVVTSDYTNSGGAPILDGYVFARGRLSTRGTSQQWYALTPPSLALSPVRPKRPIELDRLDEMKTKDPATIQDHPETPTAVEAPSDDEKEFYVPKPEELTGEQLRAISLAAQNELAKRLQQSL